MNEGETVTLVGLFSDPGLLDTHTIVIDWGDGTTSTPTSSPTPISGERTYTATHEYLGISADTVFVGSLDGTMYALDLATGSAASQYVEDDRPGEVQQIQVHAVAQ